MKRGDYRMFNRQLKANIKKLDESIGKLMDELSVAVDQEERETIMMNIDDLTKVRAQLSENKVKESYSKEVVSGIFGISAILIILKYEEKDIITSKAVNIATKLFRGV